MEQKLRLAILDMNAAKNQGMRCIRDITNLYSSVFDIDEFDVGQHYPLILLMMSIFLVEATETH